jgi:TatD DNase family protein
MLAIGECGLDKYSTVELRRQITVFEKQIELSEQAEKALIVHCVGRFNELMAMKKSIVPGQRWIIHGFRGKAQLAGQLLNAGCALSFGERFNADSLQITPLSALFAESDESELCIEDIYSKIASEKGCSPQELTAGRDFFNAKLTI